MNVTRILGTIGVAALGTLALAACQPDQSTGPLRTQPTGTAESLLRQQQLQNIQSGANPGVQNPVAVGASPGVGGIERAGTGAGSTAAGAPVAVNPGTTGIIQQPGVGAPQPGSQIRR
jgi:hypothetical protein